MLSYKLDFIIGFHPGFDKSSHNFTFQSTCIAGQKMKLLIESINIIVNVISGCMKVIFHISRY